jgi:hypothetical protein
MNSKLMAKMERLRLKALAVINRDRNKAGMTSGSEDDIVDYTKMFAEDNKTIVEKDEHEEDEIYKDEVVRTDFEKQL